MSTPKCFFKCPKLRQKSLIRTSPSPYPQHPTRVRRSASPQQPRTTNHPTSSPLCIFVFHSYSHLHVYTRKKGKGKRGMRGEGEVGGTGHVIPRLGSSENDFLQDVGSFSQARRSASFGAGVSYVTSGKSYGLCIQGDEDAGRMLIMSPVLLSFVSFFSLVSVFYAQWDLYVFHYRVCINIYFFVL